MVSTSLTSISFVFVSLCALASVPDFENPDILVDRFPDTCNLYYITDEDLWGGDLGLWECNRRRTIYAEVTPHQCPESSDRWYVEGDLTEFGAKNISKFEKFPPAVYLNLSNVEHCDVYGSIKACDDPTSLMETTDEPHKAGSGDKYDVEVPLEKVNKAVFRMKCPEEYAGYVKANLSKILYRHNPLPLPYGVVLKYHVESTDEEYGESGACSEHKIGKPECSAPSDWEDLREKCSIVREDNFVDNPKCGYKLIATLESAAVTCNNLTEAEGIYFGFVVSRWQYDKNVTVQRLRNFVLDSVRVTDEDAVARCGHVGWADVRDFEDNLVRDQCTYFDTQTLDHRVRMSAPIVSDRHGAIAKFNTQTIKYEYGGIFIFTEGHDEKCKTEFTDESRFVIKLKWAREAQCKAGSCANDVE